MGQKGVLIVNLGSPDSTEIKDIKKYLDEFLMDERVIDIPYWKRFLLIKGIILNTRPKKTKAAYDKIWKKEGSPLIITSKNFQEKLQTISHLPIALAMRYGSMSIKNGLQELHNKGVDEVFLIPMYPHYAMSSYETVVVKAQEVIAKHFKSMKLEVQPVFYNQPDYIEVLSNSIANQLKDIDYDYILFSHHGIPERHIYKSDPTNSHCKIDQSCCNTPSKAHETCYRHQCFATTEAVAKTLNFNKEQYGNSFQSRLLKDPWLKPYTDFELVNLAKAGIKNLVVVTPTFTVDCLETLEEIAMEGKHQFLEAGGENFNYLPCINDDQAWVNTVNQWIEEWSENS